MAKFQSSYQGNLRTSAKHLASGSEMITDAPTDNHGKGETFSPTDLVATALGSCMVTIMGIQAQKKGLKLDGMVWETEKIMQSNPRKIGEVKIHIHLPDSQLSEAEKDFLKEKALNCPVALTLSPEVKQTITFDI